MTATTGLKAIETVYRGARFRSRLEARWAAFFDLLGWRWEYEPIDLDGYIPDFMLILDPQPVLVEVKPAFSINGLLEAAREKIDASGWEKMALVLGASWAVTGGDERDSFNRPLGPMRERLEPSIGPVWSEARWCSEYGIVGSHYSGFWNEAGSTVRWTR